jgi:hypothetical protein
MQALFIGHLSKSLCKSAPLARRIDGRHLVVVQIDHRVGLVPAGQLLVGLCARRVGDTTMLEAVEAEPFLRVD